MRQLHPGMTPRKMIFRYRLGTVHYYSLGGAWGFLNQLKHFRNVALPKVSLSETYPPRICNKPQIPPPPQKEEHTQGTAICYKVYIPVKAAVKLVLE